MQFIDRIDAGRQLAAKLRKYGEDAVVYGLPRGGVVVAAEVARELGAPLDLVLVRKIGHPLYEEYAICAVAEGDEPVCNETERRMVDENWFQSMLAKAQAENNRRRREYFPKNYQAPVIKGKTAIVVDDGIATGLTMQAAIQSLRNRGAKTILVAVPVAPRDTTEELRTTADEVIVLDNPADFLGAVGSHYRNFTQVEDHEVIELLQHYPKSPH